MICLVSDLCFPSPGVDLWPSGSLVPTYQHLAGLHLSFACQITYLICKQSLGNVTQEIQLHVYEYSHSVYQTFGICTAPSKIHASNSIYKADIYIPGIMVGTPEPDFRSVAISEHVLLPIFYCIPHVHIARLDTYPPEFLRRPQIISV